MIQADLTMYPGIPFEQEIVVTFPEDRDWWLSTDDFEVLAQVREKRTRESKLLLDLTDHITKTFTTDHVLKIVVGLSGANTRTLNRSGYYDIVMSNTGTQDARAYALVQGSVHCRPIVTAEERGDL